MAYAKPLYPTLTETLVVDARFRRYLMPFMALLATALLALSAKIQIPFWPVPMTMQTFMVLLVGVVMGWRWGMATIALYLAEGALGLPVFAQGGGLHYFAGPTTGYLLGFVAAAGLAGYLAERGFDRHILSTVLAMTLGTALIFLCGVSWLALFMGMGWSQAAAVGLWPFMAGAAAKIALAAAVLPSIWRVVGKRHG